MTGERGLVEITGEVGFCLEDPAPDIGLDGAPILLLAAEDPGSLLIVEELAGGRGAETLLGTGGAFAGYICVSPCARCVYVFVRSGSGRCAGIVAAVSFHGVVESVRIVLTRKGYACTEFLLVLAPIPVPTFSPTPNTSRSSESSRPSSSSSAVSSSDSGLETTPLSVSVSVCVSGIARGTPNGALSGRSEASTRTVVGLVEAVDRQETGVDETPSVHTGGCGRWVPSSERHSGAHPVHYQSQRSRLAQVSSVPGPSPSPS